MSDLVKNYTEDRVVWLEAENARLQTRLAWNSERAAKAEAECDRLREDRDNWRGRAEMNARETSRLREELDRETTTSYALNEQVWALMKERDRLRKEVERWKRDWDVAMQECDRLREEMERKESERVRWRAW